MLLLEVLGAIATALLTIEGVWVIYTTKEIKDAKVMLLAPKYGRRKRICVILPAYKDTVDLDKWEKWARGENVTFVVAEDQSRINEKLKSRAIYIHRDSREGFKAGAVNRVLDYLVSKKMNFDYIILADADHVPFNNSVKEIYGYLDKPAIQFFWYDGLPMNGPFTWLCYSSRYFSNWNIYNRRFPNLTGSGIAIQYDLVKAGIRFPESITEDYALTLDSMQDKFLRISVVPFVLCMGRMSESFNAYVKQQLRWAEGTIRDGKAYFWKIMGNPDLSFYDKLDFIMHVNMYMQGIYLLVAMVLFILNASFVALFLPLIIFQGFAYFKTLSKTPKIYWPLYFFLNYYMAVVQVYAFLRAVFVSRGSFEVTQKTSKSPYAVSDKAIT